jgi:uncharacterized protein
VRPVVVVGRDLDAADDWLDEQVEAGDLVIIADVPLAAGWWPGARCAWSRGGRSSTPPMSRRVTMRDYIETIRESGELLGGPAG